MKPDYTEYNSEIGGEVRFFNNAGVWRYIHSEGEGSGFQSLEAAQAEVERFTKTNSEE